MNPVSIPSRIRPGREPNGRLSRKKSRKERFLSRIERKERDSMEVARKYRENVFGLPEALTTDQLAGSAVGRLALTKQLHPECSKTNRVMADAAFKYERQYRDYLMAISAPRQASAMDLNAVHGVNNAENVEWKRRAVEAFNGSDNVKGVRQAVAETQLQYLTASDLQGALEKCVIEDQAPTSIYELGSLREALNCLVRHYGMG